MWSDGELIFSRKEQFTVSVSETDESVLVDVVYIVADEQSVNDAVVLFFGDVVSRGWLRS